MTPSVWTLGVFAVFMSIVCWGLFQFTVRPRHGWTLVLVCLLLVAVSASWASLVLALLRR